MFTPSTIDDFGNDFGGDEWFEMNTNYGHSMATFGWLDDLAWEICFTYCVDYAAQDI